MKTYHPINAILIIILASCIPNAVQTTKGQPQGTGEVDTKAIETSMPPAPSNPATPQAMSQQTASGPDNFPDGYNPLTGQPVADPSLLDIPALLVSISHFPPIARPQAGLSFAPFVYEFTITQGSTRHLAAFYGEFPEPEIPLHGDCTIRDMPINQTKHLVGNRVWHDENKNGTQDPGEGGVGGICVNLYDSYKNLLQQSTTDSNGYYAFNVEAASYFVEFVIPKGIGFTTKDAGYEDQDSDADQSSGRTDTLKITASLHHVDAGLILSSNTSQADNLSLSLPPAVVGPIRSGRLLYDHIGKYFQWSCLIYASADPDVLAQIPGCATVPHTAKNGGAMLEIGRMIRIANQNAQKHSNFNYASNLYSNEVPLDGQPAIELFEYWAFLNQSKWSYDAASGSYWRYVDESNPEIPGVFFNAIDRLNGRQLQFENVILLIAEHEVVTPTMVDMNLELGEGGKAFLFRDGQVYDIRWSTRAGEYEKTTGLRKPIRFLNKDKSPAALKPGNTWVIVFSIPSYLEEITDGIWRARFIAPEGMD